MQNSYNWSESFNDKTCGRTERLDDFITDSFTARMFSGIQTLFNLPGGFPFRADPVALKLLTHSIIDFQVAHDCACLADHDSWNFV